MSNENSSTYKQFATNFVNDLFDELKVANYKILLPQYDSLPDLVINEPIRTSSCDDHSGASSLNSPVGARSHRYFNDTKNLLNSRRHSADVASSSYLQTSKLNNKFDLKNISSLSNFSNEPDGGSSYGRTTTTSISVSSISGVSNGLKASHDCGIIRRHSFNSFNAFNTLLGLKKNATLGRTESNNVSQARNLCLFGLAEIACSSKTNEGQTKVAKSYLRKKLSLKCIMNRAARKLYTKSHKKSMEAKIKKYYSCIDQVPKYKVTNKIQQCTSFANKLFDSIWSESMNDVQTKVE